MFKLPDLDLTRSSTVAEAASLIFHENIRHININSERFVTEGDDAALMQARIGTRRIRVALRMFRSIIPGDVRYHFKEEFKYYGQLMGRARDLDILLNGLMSEKCPIKGLEEDYKDLRRRVRKVRDKEFKQLRKALSKKKYRRLMKEFEDWTHTDLPKLSASHDQDLDDFILDTFMEVDDELLDMGADLEKYSVQGLHELRKYVKRVRYALRFFSSRIETEKVQEGYNIIVPMQDCLGHVNDVNVGSKILGEICAEVSPKKMKKFFHLSALLLEYLGEQVDTEMQNYEMIWKKYLNFNISGTDFKNV